jgi:hypothetical protein
VLGFAMGWSVPGKPEPAGDLPAVPVAGEMTRREHRKRALLVRLLDDQEQVSYRSRSAPLAELLALGMGNSFTDEDIARIVALDPVATMDELLNNPAAKSYHAHRIAKEWARQQPEKAIRYLLAKKNYRADDCLTQALAGAYPTHPKLVGEVLRSKSRQWQDRHLSDLFSETYRVRKPGAPPPQESDDPFSDDGHWIDVRFGTDLLDCLADDALREEAKGYWEEDEGVTNVSPRKPPTWDPASYDGNNDQQSALRTDFRVKPDETVARIAADGSAAARHAVMEMIVDDFSSDVQKWEKGLEELEDSIEQLGVIPKTQPRHFEMGHFLRGQVAADWLDDQPLALRRAWAADFVETWVQSDPEQALDWAAALPEEANREQAIQTGLVVWTHQNPLAAAARVEGLPPGELREAAISNAAATWNCVDPAAARKWVEGLPESAGQRRALERLKR